MLLCTIPLPQRRRSPSGKLFHDAAAASPAERQLFRTDFRFAASLRNAPTSCFRWLPVPVAPPQRPGQLLSPAARTSSSATAPRPAAFAGCPYQQLPHGVPASNKPHPAEKSTPVWLAIWRTWAGFANSQLLSAAFLSLYLYIYVPIPVTATLELLLKQTQICRPICTDCLRHLRISAK